MLRCEKIEIHKPSQTTHNFEICTVEKIKRHGQAVTVDQENRGAVHGAQQVVFQTTCSGQPADRTAGRPLFESKADQRRGPGPHFCLLPLSTVPIEKISQKRFIQALLKMLITLFCLFSFRHVTKTETY